MSKEQQKEQPEEQQKEQPKEQQKEQPEEQQKEQPEGIQKKQPMAPQKEQLKEPLKLQKEKQRRNTWILLVALFSVFLILFLVQRRGMRVTDPDEGLIAVIQVDGDILHTMPLGEDAVYKAQDSSGHFNLIEVADGSVMVRAADCKNQVCVKTGKIRYQGEVIACLPHRLIVSIEEEFNTRWKTN